MAARNTNRTPEPSRRIFDPYTLLGELEEQQVLYVVVGTLARVIRGTGELTSGIDIVPAMRTQNLRRLSRGLQHLDARRIDGEACDLDRDLDKYPVLELVTRAGTLKIVPEPLGTRGYIALRRYASCEPLGRGLNPQVASLIDLGVMLWALDREDELAIVHRVLDLEHHRRRPKTPSRRTRTS